MRSMKDSGVEWIGEIPEYWNLRKLSHLLTSIGSGTTPKNKVDYYKGDISWLNTGDLNDGQISQIKKTVSELAVKDYSALKIYPENSVVIAMYGATIGKLGIITSPTTTNQACCVMTCGTELIPLYLYYSLFGMRPYILTLAYGAGQPNISANTIRFLPILLPSLNEQTRIASFLDKKCAAIDSAIKNQRASIDKLKEYRQAVITEAVTKGLNPDVPMKDSGVEWIGEIPEKWDVTKVSMLYNVILGKMLSNNPSDEFDSLENYLCAANLKWDGIRIDEVKRMWFSETEKSRYLLTKGDIVVTEGGDIGVSSEYLGEASPCYIQNAVHKVTAKDKSASNKLFYYWMCAVKNSGYLDLICNKATIAHYTKEKLSTTPVLAIPIKEQTEIAAYLDKKCSVIDKTVSGKEKLIEKLEEYKKSLIYEAVTGKIEVPT
ncbi:restriction endonuclease subunit S [Methanoplanus endosymbiosus]|uniref:Restriction endonuclease subunit S n=1 Tax=Methanoplanus endosymbiosus TaxID=33865 RepID=A0A9E7PR22_9EURY|nr:restriction endonuclease subunit S [Methanoplanus endosymbiosus]UUX91927.1 restriction endonuclease subunit S [Methanoplanus endosymbiosus]